VVWIVYGLVLCLGLVHYGRKFRNSYFLWPVRHSLPGELIVSIGRRFLLGRNSDLDNDPLFPGAGGGHISQLKFSCSDFCGAGEIATFIFSVGDY